MVGSLTTVREATSAYLRERRQRGELTVASERGYRARLDSFEVAVGPDRAVGKLHRRHVDDFLDTLGRLSPASRRAYFVTARLFCRWLREKGAVDRDLFAERKAPKEPRSVPRNLSAEQVAALLSVSDDRERVTAIVMLQTGIRRGEMARLCVEDIDFVNRMALVHGKGGHEDMVPLPDQAVTELERWLFSQGITSGPVLRSRTNPDAGLTPATVGDLLSSALYRAGVKRCGWDRVSGHSLRHTAASDMLRSGAHVRDVQRILRHTSLQTTERYFALVVGGLAVAAGGRSY